MIHYPITVPTPTGVKWRRSLAHMDQASDHHVRYERCRWSSAGEPITNLRVIMSFASGPGGCPGPGPVGPQSPLVVWGGVVLGLQAQLPPWAALTIVCLIALVIMAVS
jgi:hypothetical protein